MCDAGFEAGNILLLCSANYTAPTRPLTCSLGAFWTAFVPFPLCSGTAACPAADVGDALSIVFGSLSSELMDESAYSVFAAMLAAIGGHPCSFGTLLDWMTCHA